MKLTFETALVHLKQGKRIRRASERDIYYVAEDGWIHGYTTEYNELTPFPFDGNDVLANDWEVVE